MIDPEDANYVCTLSEASLAKAAKELYEDPKQRLGAVQTLRKWIREQKHFTCRTDTEYLLQVLRTAKFSQLRAREIVETILTWRTQCPQYLCNYDTHDPGLLEYVDRGIIIPLPRRDKEGRAITVIRFGLIDTSRVTEEMEIRANLTVGLLRKDENTIVNGEMLVFDLTGLSSKHVTRALESDKKAHKIYQECMVGRMKGLHFYNGGAFFEVLMGIARPLTKQKYLERIFVHSTMESLYKEIPMEFWPDEYLPDDYKGPSAGSIASIVADVKQRLLDPKIRARILDISSDRYKIDFSAAKSAGAGPRESFRKLNVD